MAEAKRLELLKVLFLESFWTNSWSTAVQVSTASGAERLPQKKQSSRGRLPKRFTLVLLLEECSCIHGVRCWSWHEFFVFKMHQNLVI